MFARFLAKSFLPAIVKRKTQKPYTVLKKRETKIVAELPNPKLKINVNLTNSQSRTPLDIAREGGIIKLLTHGVEVKGERKHEETVLVESAQDQNETGNQNKKVTPTFQKTKGAAGIEGQLCEINLAIFLLLKAKFDPRLTEYYLATNVDKADKFDDIVFKYKNIKGKSKTIFLQSKHKTGETKSIRLNDLLADSESGDFAIKKYLLSWRKVKKNFLSNENADDPVFSGNFEECEFVLYTNAPFEHGINSCIKEIAMDDNDLFKTKDSQGKICQLDFDSVKERIFELVKNSSDCRRLAKALADAIYSETGLDIQKGVCQTYHRALKEKLIKKIKNSKNGKLREDFFSSADNKFRTVFFEEAAKVFKKSEHAIKEKLQGTEIKLSNKFWNGNSSGFSNLPDDDPIEEHEVENFLSKFKLYADQPNEKALESAIKELAVEFYKIEQQDINLVYAGFFNKVKDWWQDKNYYLMKDNKFFEDALRVSVEFDVIEPVSLFTGRSQALKDLHRMLQEVGTVSISQRATVSGLGGLGKSELARKYLSEYKKHYDNNIIWINAENNLTITQSFQKLAGDKLKIKITDEKNKEKDIKLLTEEVYNFFTKMHRKSIFVFDNAEKRWPGEGYVNKLLPSGLNKPYFIITTRHQDWYGIQKLSLGLFTQEEAETYLRNALKDKIKFEDHEVQALIEELGYLPLALSQAVAYISVENIQSAKWSGTPFTISCYLNLLQENAKKILSGRIDDHTKTVMTTWKTSIEKIKEVSELALEILHIMAYLASDEIEVDEIFGKEIGDQKQIHRAMELLEQYSMIGINGGKVNIHRLVQKVTRVEMEEREQNEQTLANTFALLKACYPYGSEKMDDHFKMRRMLPHLEVFLSHIEKMWKNKTPEEQREIEKEYIFELFECMAHGYQNNPRRSKELHERALTLKENNYGPDHFEVAITLGSLGNAYGALGDALKQKELLERALPIMENYYGRDHFQVAITLTNLGNAYGALGDALKKKKLLARALPINEKYYGRDHFQVAITLTNLGNAYGALGDAQKQKELLERALLINENFYGPDHFQVAGTVASLGDAYHALGDAQKSKQLLERALNIQENYYGPDHFEVAITLGNLGIAYGALGDALKKKELLERALSIEENYYGPDHVHVVATLTNLSNAYGDLGDARKQKELLERALPIKEKYYGPDHSQVALTLTNLGSAYGALGDALKKKELLERALPIFENYYGPDHFKVAVTLTNLGSAFGALGDALEKKELLERALAIEENYYGPDHVHVAATLTNLGNAYGDLGDALKKKELLERALPIKEKYYGADHFQVAITLGNLGNAYGALGDALKQKELLERALAIEENYYGPDHVHVAATLTNLGNASGDLGDALKKKELLERALPIKEKYYGPNHFSVAITLTNLGNAYGDLGDVPKKKELLERALSIEENYYGPDHFQVAITLANLGNAYGALGDPLKKKELLERALPIMDNYYGPDHLHVATTLTNLGNAYGALGDAQKQKELLERALLKNENFYGPDHFQVARTLASLGDAYHALGDAQKSKQLLERALNIQENYYGPDHIEVAFTRVLLRKT